MIPEYYESSPYYDETDTVLGWGVWCKYANDWAIDDGLDEDLSKDIANYLNNINSDVLLQMCRRHGKDTVYNTLRFYGFGQTFSQLGGLRVALFLCPVGSGAGSGQVGRRVGPGRAPGRVGSG